MEQLTPYASPTGTLTTDPSQDLGDIRVKALRRMYEHHFADFFSENAQLKNVLTALPDSVSADLAAGSQDSRPE